MENIRQVSLRAGVVLDASRHTSRWCRQTASSPSYIMSALTRNCEFAGQTLIYCAKKGGQSLFLSPTLFTALCLTGSAWLCPTLHYQPWVSNFLATLLITLFQLITQMTKCNAIVMSLLYFDTEQKQNERDV